MLSVFDSFRSINFVTVLFRMLLATACGALIGLERSSKNRPAGFRTHILVCIGAATASMTGHYLYLNLHLPADMTRLGAQVITGLGFLGAGTILVTNKGSVKGLTTAAGLWASGVAGLAIGGGFYEGGIVATVLILLVETVFSKIGKRIRHFPEFRIRLYYNEKPALDHMMRYCKDLGITITGLQITGTVSEEQSFCSALISLRPDSSIDEDSLLDRIRALSGVIMAESA